MTTATNAWNQLLDVAQRYHARFVRDCGQPRAAQENFLQHALDVNSGAELGQKFHFSAINNYGQYAERMPIVDYHDVAHDLAKWSKGQSTLCAEPVVHQEWTSGSTLAAKLIPYSNAGLDGFRHALYPWLCDLCRTVPGFAQGRAYWALSPAGTGAFADRASGDDAIYFGDAASLLVHISAVPLALSTLSDSDEWLFWSALFLAAADDLNFISIWSPTFLHPLLDVLIEQTDKIADALVNPLPHGPPPALQPALAAVCSNGVQTAQRLRDATRGNVLDTRVLWPMLNLISCWTEGSAARHIAGLRRRFPNVSIQPKGLISTEAAVSVPLTAPPNPVAAVNSSFLELHRDDGTCMPLWEWREGDQGRVVVTTRSGLWRYDTGDRVVVTGYYRQTPTLAFVGRGDLCVDLCGEKLDESLLQQRLPTGIDAFVAPTPDNRGYYLFLEAGASDRESAKGLAQRVEEALGEVLHYRHARAIGQLKPVCAVRVKRLSAAIAQRLRETRGTPLATIKVPTLDKDDGWFEYFVRTGALEKT
ncbi:GH3 family domain-containing protein [Thiosocius teredinicola]|uniref:GH3 family domain-containing protein n=1 Tax=Thiosocius teredinicola TaxID=1973002 RepID=UPI0013DDB967